MYIQIHANMMNNEFAMIADLPSTCMRLEMSIYVQLKLWKFLPIRLFQQQSRWRFATNFTMPNEPEAKRCDKIDDDDTAFVRKSEVSCENTIPQ